MWQFVILIMLVGPMCFSLPVVFKTSKTHCSFSKHAHPLPVSCRILGLQKQDLYKEQENSNTEMRNIWIRCNCKVKWLPVYYSNAVSRETAILVVESWPLFCLARYHSLGPAPLRISLPFDNSPLSHWEGQPKEKK